MKVLIIIPIYNVSKYISDCIKSVLVQTYKEIECILVDDCGTDDSMEICNKLISSYRGRIKFIILHHKMNRGQSAARNTGTEVATGDYIFYLDSDDMLYPKCIELMMDAVKKHPEVELVQGGIDSRPFSEYFSIKTLKNISYTEEPYWMRLHFFSEPVDFKVVSWNKLLKRDFLIKNKLFFKEGLIHEDELWMYFVALSVSRIAIVHEKTYIHFTRENSIMTTNSIERAAKHWGVILTKITDNLQEPYAERALLTYLLRYISYYKISVSDKVYNVLYKRFQYWLYVYHHLFLNIFLFLYKWIPVLLMRKIFFKVINYSAIYYLKHK